MLHLILNYFGPIADFFHVLCLNHPYFSLNVFIVKNIWHYSQKRLSYFTK